MLEKDQESSDLKAFFEKQQQADFSKSLPFEEIFNHAKLKHIKMKSRNYLMALVALIILVAGISFASNKPKNDGPIPILKAGVSLYAKLMKEGKIISYDIHFGYDDISLKSESYGVINKLAEMMIEHPELRISIEGHTDNTGSSDYNMKLSSARAEAVKSALVNLKIAPSRLNAAGYGENKPIADNKNETGRAKNRRVEFVLVK